MAIFFQDMNDQERADLTMAMVNSGDTIDLSAIEGVKVDKTQQVALVIQRHLY